MLQTNSILSVTNHCPTSKEGGSLYPETHWLYLILLNLSLSESKNTCLPPNCMRATKKLFLVTWSSPWRLLQDVRLVLATSPSLCRSYDIIKNNAESRPVASWFFYKLLQTLSKLWRRRRPFTQNTLTISDAPIQLKFDSITNLCPSP